MAEWIKIEPGCEMPKDRQSVWCYSESWTTGTSEPTAPSRYVKDGKRFLVFDGIDDYYGEVTHWAPRTIRKPPEE